MTAVGPTPAGGMPPPTPVVSNTGPLIALGKADLLAVLKAIAGRVQVPPAVHRELLAKSGPEAARLDAALADFVDVVVAAAPPPDVEQATRDLDPGEQQAVRLAAASGAVLLMDDRVGRRAAQGLGLRLTGTAGLLIEAKRRGIIAEVVPLLRAIRDNGYWLSEALIQTAAARAGE